MKRIVLTGGPGAGKTMVAAGMARDEPETFVVVPEAATQVYRRLQTRWDLITNAERRDVQRRIYALQVEQEEHAFRGQPGKVLLLDRGTVDGAAYWPDGPEHYWREIGTTHAAELARYDAVVWLETCAAVGAYDGDASNVCRHEDTALAIDRGNAVLRLWQDHPRLVRVKAYPTFREKLLAVKVAIREAMTLPPLPCTRGRGSRIHSIPNRFFHSASCCLNGSPPAAPALR